MTSTSTATQRPPTPLPRVTSAWRRVPTALRVLLYVFGAYLVGRAGVEFARIDYGDPASYRLDWGGPSLLGVLAVHTGPGLAIAGYTVAYWWRRWTR